MDENSTSANRARALRKIRACLRLSQSSNPNEAAAALRQAQKLMADFGIDASDTAVDVGSSAAPTRHRGATPPESVVALAALIARAFRCQAVVQMLSGQTAVRFFGADGAPVVAVYAFTVLRRQLDADKSRHVRRCRKRVVKEQRAEVFAQGWVRAVCALFPATELPPAHARAIAAAAQAFAAAGGGSLGETSGRKLARTRVRDDDIYAGFAADKKARYSPGVQGAGPLGIGHDGEAL